jgi:hypothetical protein
MPDYTPTAEQAIAMKWGLIRDKRDVLLAETDWWATSDRTMTSDQTDYRKKLRDIPQDYGSPDDVVYPTKP